MSKLETPHAIVTTASLRQNAKAGIATIRKTLKVGCNVGHALEIGASFAGFKDYKTLKGIEDNKSYYVARVDISQTLAHQYADIELGFLDTLEEATSQVYAMAKQARISSRHWVLHCNGEVASLFPESPEYDIEDTHGKLHINDIPLEEGDRAFDDAFYKLVHREDEVSDLYRFIAEAPISERGPMIEMLELLDSVDDEYVLQNTRYNDADDVLIHSYDPEAFNEAIADLLAIQKKLSGDSSEV